MTRFILFLIVILFFFSCDNRNNAKEKDSRITGCYAPKTTDKEWYTSGKKAPLFEGLEGIDFKITTL